MANTVSRKSKKVVILGAGNLLLRDEGFGIHVIRALRESALPSDSNIEIIDGGTSPNILYLLDEADKIILIDAVEGGSQPGTIYRFHAGDITEEDKCALSMHEMGLLDDLKIRELTGEKVEAVIIGIEPEELGTGMELSLKLEKQIPQVVKLVLNEIREEAKC